MKTKVTIAILFLTAIGVIARLSAPFLGWDRLESDSPCIIVADPKEPTPPTPGFGVVNGPRSDFSIAVLSVLKGTNEMRHASLQTDYELRPRQAYLVFASYDDGIYRAYEEFKVVPLGIKFKQEMIEGKPLDEQLQILFQLAIDNLNDEMTQKQAEKERLEAAVKMKK